MKSLNNLKRFFVEFCVWKDEFTSGKMIVDNKIWLFSKIILIIILLRSLVINLKKNSIPIPVSLTNSMFGYENKHYSIHLFFWYHWWLLYDEY
jgi:hypothetical protein